ncbi:MAG: V-type ATPase subunit [Clostridiales bacterium]|nr:V-type ATPase subunit [Clostridiales bacterium]
MPTTKIAGYEALTAKSRCLMGMLLKKEQYSELLLTKSLPEAADYLRNLPSYRSTFEQIEPSRIGRSTLEYLLEQNLIEVYVRFYKFSHGAERSFFAGLLREFEVYYLLEAIKTCLTGTESDHLYRLPTFFNHHSDLNFHRIFSSRTPSELLDALSGTEYYQSCGPMLSGTQDFDFLLLESLLYKHYYHKLYYSDAKVLNRADAAAFRTALTYRVDLINLVKIMRMRRFAKVSKGEMTSVSNLLSYLIPLRLHLTDGDITRIASAQNDARALEICDSIFPGFSELLNADKYQGNIIEYYMKKHAEKLTRNPGHSLMTVYGFLILKGIEVNNIIHAIEAIRYSLPPSLGEHSLVL